MPADTQSSATLSLGEGTVSFNGRSIGYIQGELTVSYPPSPKNRVRLDFTCHVCGKSVRCKGGRYAHEGEIVTTYCPNCKRTTRGRLTIVYFMSGSPLGKLKSSYYLAKLSPIEENLSQKSSCTIEEIERT